MNTDTNDVPLNVDLLYKYLLNTDVFPVGYIGGLETYLEEILREHERHGGVPASKLNPLQALTSCMKLLRKKGYYKLRHQNSWERVNFTRTKDQQNHDEAVATDKTAASIVPFISS